MQTQPLTSRPLFTRVGDLIGRCEPNLLKLDCAPAGRARKGGKVTKLPSTEKNTIDPWCGAGIS